MKMKNAFKLATIMALFCSTAFAAVEELKMGPNPNNPPYFGPGTQTIKWGIHGDYADSTPGAINQVSSWCVNSGARYCVPLWGVGQATGTGGASWGVAGVGAAEVDNSYAVGGQFDAVSNGNGTNAISLLMGAGGTKPITAYLQVTTNAAATAAQDMFVINDSNFNPMQTTGSLFTTNGGGLLSTTNLLNFPNATFSGYLINSQNYQLTGSGRSYASDGSATAPSYSFKSNSGLGSYNAGFNTIAWSTNSTLRMYLNNAGLGVAGKIQGFGARELNAVIYTGNVTINSNDDVIIIRRATGAATAVTLPTCTAGRRLVVKDGKGDAATNNITISGGTIDGAASHTINSNYGKTTLVCDSSGSWNNI